MMQKTRTETPMMLNPQAQPMGAESNPKIETNMAKICVPTMATKKRNEGALV